MCKVVRLGSRLDVSLLTLILDLVISHDDQRYL